MLHGEKVFLRPIETEDLKIIHKWRNSSQFLYAGIPTPTPYGKLKDWYEEVLKEEGKIFLICDRLNDNPIGTIRLFDIERKSYKGDLEIMIKGIDEDQDGYAIEAIQLFLNFCYKIKNLRRIAITITEDKENLLNILEKVGFKREGRKRRSVYRDGDYLDELVLAIFKKEFYD